jgi:hypothetical protein
MYTVLVWRSIELCLRGDKGLPPTAIVIWTYRFYSSWWNGWLEKKNETYVKMFPERICSVRFRRYADRFYAHSLKSLKLLYKYAVYVYILAIGLRLYRYSQKLLQYVRIWSVYLLAIQCLKWRQSDKKKKKKTIPQAVYHVYTDVLRGGKKH